MSRVLKEGQYSIDVDCVRDDRDTTLVSSAAHQFVAELTSDDRDGVCLAHDEAFESYVKRVAF